MSGVELEKAYNNLMKHAHDNYTKGWDYFVETVSLIDFIAEVEEYGLTTHKEIMDHYTDTVQIRFDYAEDIRAEGRDDYSDDGDALASAGMGTDEDYGYYGEDDF